MSSESNAFPNYDYALDVKLTKGVGGDVQPIYHARPGYSIEGSNWPQSHWFDVEESDNRLISSLGVLRR